MKKIISIIIILLFFCTISVAPIACDDSSNNNEPEVTEPNNPPDSNEPTEPQEPQPPEDEEAEPQEPKPPEQEEPKEPKPPTEEPKEDPKPVYDGIDDYYFYKDDFIAGMNDARTKGAPCAPGGLSNVKWDKELANAALQHSLDMARNNFFDHTGSDGSKFFQRIGDTAFQGYPAGENIGAGYTTINSVISGWLNSSGHCRNIMNPQVTHMGYALVIKSGTQWTYYHTMVTGIK